MPVILLLIIITLASIVSCHYIAQSRGGNAVYWGVMGLLFGPFAIPFAFRAKPRKTALTEERDTLTDRE
jgi:hypothetical protein